MVLAGGPQPVPEIAHARGEGRHGQQVRRAVQPLQGAEGQGGDYRMAAGDDPRLAALIDETIAGEPFDASQEKAAQAKGWR